MATETTTIIPTTSTAEPVRQTNRRPQTEAAMQVRAADLEPYVGLRYLSKLFKLMAIVMILLLVAEIITGLIAQGSAAVPTLLGEVSRLVVLAGLLWGSGDLAILLIDMGHDVRAARILLGRSASHPDHAHDSERPHHHTREP
jgi:hypothetical protein